MPGTALRIAFSMTVEPFSASTSKCVPSWAMKVSLVICHLKGVPAEIITPPDKSTAARKRRFVTFFRKGGQSTPWPRRFIPVPAAERQPLPADGGDEIAHFLD